MRLHHRLPPTLSLSPSSPPRHCFSLFIPNPPSKPFLLGSSSSSFPLFPKPAPKFESQRPRVSSGAAAERHASGEEERWRGEGIEVEDLGVEGEVFKKTLRLVECSMLASVSGLAYILSNTLAIENYFGCFFPLPIVMSSMRWGVAAGRKTMVATALLLFMLSGPIKALSYLDLFLFHGQFIVGIVLIPFFSPAAYVWISWPDHGFFVEVGDGLGSLSCSVHISNVRITGVLGYVLLTSFLIRENILSLITINTHAGITYALTSIGLNTVPSTRAIYVLFGFLLLVNCGFFVFLLHILYAVFLSKLGMKASLTLPRWLENSI